MKVKIEIDPDDSKKDFQKARSIIDILEDKTINPGQQPLNTNNQYDDDNTSNNSDNIAIVIRDGSKKTVDVKEDLKRHGFTYYKYKKNSKKEDPRYTQTCNKSFWDSIKDQTVFEGLNIWTSDGGEST